MGEKPLILALANPTPEIMPEEVFEVRPDACHGTGRSDYPNQVNNVLCFPYMFPRRARCRRNSTINEEMKTAAVEAIASIARKKPSDIAARAYGRQVRDSGQPT
jgi:malate dehydrogenase (oxaloacetate-decarboxylating)(NADP+)